MKKLQLLASKTTRVAIRTTQILLLIAAGIVWWQMAANGERTAWEGKLAIGLNLGVSLFIEFLYRFYTYKLNRRATPTAMNEEANPTPADEIEIDSEAPTSIPGESLEDYLERTKQERADNAPRLTREPREAAHVIVRKGEEVPEPPIVKAKKPFTGQFDQLPGGGRLPVDDDLIDVVGPLQIRLESLDQEHDDITAQIEALRRSQATNAAKRTRITAAMEALLT